MNEEGDLEEALAEVVRLHPERDLTDEDAPVASAERPPYCSHRQGAILNREAHKVLCKECGRELDAFAQLEKIAGEWERYATFRKEAKRRADEAHARLTELLRLETNARARLKRIDPDAEKAAPQRPWGNGSIW